MNENLPLSGCATPSTRTARGSRRARGFTLIEVLVAVAIFTILLVIVFVPLTQATRFLAIGRTRASLQQSANGTMTQLQRDLSRAIYVYPNDVLPGVTDVLPYTNNGNVPYIGGTGKNTSRLDLLLPELSDDGSVKYPVTPAKYIVTYYARRRNLVDGTGTPLNFDSYNNPIVLFRAQYPYMDASGNRATFASNGVDTSNTRYGNAAGLNWLTMNANNEFDQIEALCNNATGGGGLVPSNHTLVTPTNVQLVLPLDATNQPIGNSFKPNTTFNLADTNRDGKIDRVTVSLTLMNFNRQNRNDGGNDSGEAINNNPNFQRFTLNQTFNLPNIR